MIQFYEKKCDPIDWITSAHDALMCDLIETMEHHQALGIAAPQIGVSKRMFCVSKSLISSNLETPQCFIDSLLISIGLEQQSAAEGCLSLPNRRAAIARPKNIIVQTTRIDGHRIEICASGLLARVILHEMDHLDGKLMIDDL